MRPKYHPREYRSRSGLWFIEYNPKPGPSSRWDWDYWHEDFDGGPWEAGGPPMDSRQGAGRSAEECMEFIKEWEEDQEELDQ